MADQPIRTGAGEPSRTLALLWRRAAGRSPRKGPGRGSTVDAVVAAALGRADDAGIEAVTVRAVADRVGVSTMSVYTYVPAKAELVDLMVDAVYLAMPRPAWRSRSWRRRLTQVAQANRDLLTAHPWLTDVVVLSRPPLGPGLMAKYEHELAALDDTGLSDVESDASLTFLLGFVHSYARAARDAARATRDSAMSDADWWAANEPWLGHALDPDAYPRAVRIGGSAGAAQGASWSADHAWRFGLARSLDGLAALIERRRRRA
jgi:AcrR family transcriptional regulator